MLASCIHSVYNVSMANKKGGKNMQTKLKGLRAEHGVTQADMADLLGVTRQTYTEKENGNQPFKADELFIISGYFDKPIEQIFLNNKYTKRIHVNKKINGKDERNGVTNI